MGLLSWFLFFFAATLLLNIKMLLIVLIFSCHVTANFICSKAFWWSVYVFLYAKFEGQCIKLQSSIYSSNPAHDVEKHLHFEFLPSSSKSLAVCMYVCELYMYAYSQVYYIYMCRSEVEIWR